MNLGKLRLTPALIISACIFLSGHDHGFSAEPGTAGFNLTRRAHCWLLPRTEAVPEIDGAGSDQIWQEKYTEAGTIATPGGEITHRVRASTDGYRLYLLITG